MDDPANSLLDELHAVLNANATAEHLCRLGARLHQAGQLAAALKAFEVACEKAPAQLHNWMAIATLRLELNLPHAALEACNHALRLAPENPQLLFSSGVVLAALGDKAAALHCYDKALLKENGHYGALRNRPMLLADLGRMCEARQAAQDATAAYPHDPWLFFNLGELLLGMQAMPASEAAFRRALALAPEFHQARYALSIALAAQGRMADAYTAREAALAAAPGLAESYRSPLVLDAFDGSNDVRPERVAVIAAFEALYSCDWRGLTATSKLYAELVQGQHGNPPLDQHEMPYLALGLPVGDEVRRQVARQTAARVIHNVKNARLPRRERGSSPEIRIGYLSANFSPHPSAQLMGDIYARHARGRFKVHAYSVGENIESMERTRVRAGVDVFREIQCRSDEAAAQLIVNDGIDILVDLSGFMKGARPEILALRPAPVQVSYMDFIGTQGASYIDYTMLDRNILIPESRAFWDEKIAYLPNCSYHCERPAAVRSCSRSEVGLPEQGMVLGALHRSRKLDPESFNVWLALLQSIPNSVLWLLFENDVQAENLKRWALERGVAEQRLVFAPLVEHSRHIARLSLTDICLDTFLYNGHTTTIDALSAGVPVVTLRGNSPVARVAASMLAAHGLPELIAETVDEYKAIAFKLANDTIWRKEIRLRVADYQDSKLFCPETRVREIETAYTMMWERHQAGLPPADFDVPEWAPASVARS